MPQQSTIVFRNPLFWVQEMMVFGSHFKFANIAVGMGCGGSQFQLTGLTGAGVGGGLGMPWKPCKTGA